MSVDNKLYPWGEAGVEGTGGKTMKKNYLHGSFEFKNYAPLVFHALRQQSGIQLTDYMVRDVFDSFISSIKKTIYFFFTYNVCSIV